MSIYCTRKSDYIYTCIFSRKLSVNGGFIKRPCIGRSPPGDSGLYRVASMKGHIPPFVYPGNFVPSASFETHCPQRVGRFRNSSKSRSPVLFMNACDQREAENFRGHGADAAQEEDLLNMVGALLFTESFSLKCQVIWILTCYIIYSLMKNIFGPRVTQGNRDITR